MGLLASIAGRYKHAAHCPNASRDLPHGVGTEPEMIEPYKENEAEDVPHAGDERAIVELEGNIGTVYRRDEQTKPACLSVDGIPPHNLYRACW